MMVAVFHNCSLLGFVSLKALKQCGMVYALSCSVEIKTKSKCKETMYGAFTWYLMQLFFKSINNDYKVILLILAWIL